MILKRTITNNYYFTNYYTCQPHSTISWNKNYKMKKKQILDLEIDLHETYMKLECNLHKNQARGTNNGCKVISLTNLH
jgi:hypothetical protein